jgi:hypothetical protein
MGTVTGGISGAPVKNQRHFAAGADWARQTTRFSAGLGSPGGQALGGRFRDRLRACWPDTRLLQTRPPGGWICCPVQALPPLWDVRLSFGSAGPRKRPAAQYWVRPSS